MYCKSLLYFRDMAKCQYFSNSWFQRPGAFCWPNGLTEWHINEVSMPRSRLPSCRVTSRSQWWIHVYTNGLKWNSNICLAELISLLKDTITKLLTVFSCPSRKQQVDLFKDVMLSLLSPSLLKKPKCWWRLKRHLWTDPTWSSSIDEPQLLFLTYHLHLKHAGMFLAGFPQPPLVWPAAKISNLLSRVFYFGFFSLWKSTGCLLGERWSTIGIVAIVVYVQDEDGWSLCLRLWDESWFISHFESCLFISVFLPLFCLFLSL